MRWPWSKVEKEKSEPIVLTEHYEIKVYFDAPALFKIVLIEWKYDRPYWIDIGGPKWRITYEYNGRQHECSTNGDNILETVREHIQETKERDIREEKELRECKRIQQQYIGVHNVLPLETIP